MIWLFNFSYSDPRGAPQILLRHLTLNLHFSSMNMNQRSNLYELRRTKKHTVTSFCTNNQLLIQMSSIQHRPTSVLNVAYKVKEGI